MTRKKKAAPRMKRAPVTERDTPGLRIIKTESSVEVVDRQMVFFKKHHNFAPVGIERISDTEYLFDYEPQYGPVTHVADIRHVLNKLSSQLWEYTGNLVSASALADYINYTMEKLHEYLYATKQNKSPKPQVVKDVVECLHWLGMQEIRETREVHGDLTLENILVAKNSIGNIQGIRLIDPGMVRCGVKCVALDTGKLLQSLLIQWEKCKLRPGFQMPLLSCTPNIHPAKELKIDSTLEKVFFLTHLIRILPHRERHDGLVIQSVFNNLKHHASIVARSLTAEAGDSNERWS